MGKFDKVQSELDAIINMFEMIKGEMQTIATKLEQVDELKKEAEAIQSSSRFQ